MFWKEIQRREFQAVSSQENSSQCRVYISKTNFSLFRDQLLALKHTFARAAVFIALKMCFMLFIELNKMKLLPCTIPTLSYLGFGVAGANSR